MGTNYYHRTNICDCCGRYEERHIGKHSAGWQFSFQAIDEDQLVIQSRKDWYNHLINESGKIFDEYGQELTLEELHAIVESSRGGIVHARRYPGDGFVDEAGWSFTIGEFS